MPLFISQSGEPVICQALWYTRDTKTKEKAGRAWLGHSEGVPDGAANENKGKGIGRFVSRVAIIHEDRKMGYKEQKMRKDNKNRVQQFDFYTESLERTEYPSVNSREYLC